MRTYTAAELAEMIERHGRWLCDKEGGEQTDLSYSDLSDSNLRYSDLRYSNLSYSNLRYSNLRYSDLSDSNLRGSDLSGSDLSDSNLSGSDLSGSNLSGSNLSGSNLSGSNLSGSKGLIYITQRSDGYQFFAVHDGDNWMIRAGCRLKTIADYRAHTQSYSCNKKRSETLLILEFAERMIADRGIVEVKEKSVEVAV
jgi:uncharacterized protein YjbI with pentapeptide repeats